MRSSGTTIGLPAGLLALLATGAAPHAATLAPDEVFSSILVLAIAPTRPVLGADDRVHPAYELMLDESRSEEIFVKSVPAVIERDRLAGAHANQLPLDDMVVRFSE